MINRLHYEMIRLYSWRSNCEIQHFCKVHSYAKLIAEMGHVDASTLFILEAAALTHDIGIHLCEENTEVQTESFRKRKDLRLQKNC